jgi:hypothetical protein
VIASSNVQRFSLRKGVKPLLLLSFLIAGLVTINLSFGFPVHMFSPGGLISGSIPAHEYSIAGISLDLSWPAIYAAFFPVIVIIQSFFISYPLRKIQVVALAFQLVILAVCIVYTYVLVMLATIFGELNLPVVAGIIGIEIIYLIAGVWMLFPGSRIARLIF